MNGFRTHDQNRLYLMMENKSLISLPQLSNDRLQSEFIPFMLDLRVLMETFQIYHF